MGQGASFFLSHGAEFTLEQGARFAVAQSHPRSPRMSSLKSPCRTSNWSSIDAIDVSFFFRKPRFYVRVYIRTNKRTGSSRKKPRFL